MEKIYDYCVANSNLQDELLEELSRETYLKALSPHMVSGPLQGQLLTLVTRMIRPRNALEIGTFTGYASICIAKGLPFSGHLTTIEIEEELSVFHEKYFPMSGLNSQISCLYGDANTILPDLDIIFDFVFMDAGKKDYLAQYELLLSKMKSGGVILADNVLWKGRVLEENPDKMTQYILAFNEMVRNDDRVDNMILPIRDGIHLIIVR